MHRQLEKEKIRNEDNQSIDKQLNQMDSLLYTPFFQNEQKNMALSSL